jgi:hypothetical protein
MEANAGMRSLFRTWLLISLVAVAVAVAAQDKPDFSGRWVLDYPPEPALDIPRTLTISQPIVRANISGHRYRRRFSSLRS